MSTTTAEDNQELNQPPEQEEKIKPFLMVPKELVCLLAARHLKHYDESVLLALYLYTLGFAQPRKNIKRETFIALTGMPRNEIVVSMSRLIKMGWVVKTGRGEKAYYEIDLSAITNSFVSTFSEASLQMRMFRAGISRRDIHTVIASYPQARSGITTNDVDKSDRSGITTDVSRESRPNFSRESRPLGGPNPHEIIEEFGPLETSKSKDTLIDTFQESREGQKNFDYFHFFEKRWKEAYSDRPKATRERFINGEKKLVRELSQKYDQVMIYAAFEVLSKRGIDYKKQPIIVLPTVVRICFEEERIQHDPEIKARTLELKTIVNSPEVMDENLIDVDVKGLLNKWLPNMPIPKSL